MTLGMFLQKSISLDCAGKVMIVSDKMACTLLVAHCSVDIKTSIMIGIHI